MNIYINNKRSFLFVLILFCGALSVQSMAEEKMHAILAYSDGTVVKLTDENREAIFGNEGFQTKDLFTTHGVNFNINYQDVNTGFNDLTLGPQRKAVLQSALEYIASVLNVPGGKVDVNVSSVYLAGQFLANAGPIVVWYEPITPAINNGCVFQHLLNGSVDPDGPSLPDMQLTVNWNYTYNLGTGDPGPMEFDLLSVLIHEITHGIGFLASIAYNDSGCGGGTRPNGTGWTGSQPDIYTAFDTFLITGNNHFFISSSFYYIGASSYFLGVDNGVYCSASGAAGLWGTRPRIYSPSVYECGSSISHWNNLGGIMDPSIPPGTKKRAYLPFEVAFLKDIGYINAAEPSSEGEGSVEGAGEGSVEGMPEGEGIAEGEPFECNYILECPNFNEEGIQFYNELASKLGNPAINWHISDLDGLGIPDSWEIALLKKVLCQPQVYWRLDATCVYLRNIEKLKTEPQYNLWLQPYEHVIAGLLSIGTELQTSLSSLNLVNDYETIKGGTKSYNEILSGVGDADRDGYSNHKEYSNCINNGLGLNEYLIVVLHPDLDGTESPDDALPVISKISCGIVLLLIFSLGSFALIKHKIQFQK